VDYSFFSIEIKEKAGLDFSSPAPQNTPI